MEILSGHSELSVISQVSTVEECPLSGVPLYTALQESLASIKFGKVNSAGKKIVLCHRMMCIHKVVVMFAMAIFTQ